MFGWLSKRSSNSFRKEEESWADACRRSYREGQQAADERCSAHRSEMDYREQELDKREDALRDRELKFGDLEYKTGLLTRERKTLDEEWAKLQKQQDDLKNKRAKVVLEGMRDVFGGKTPHF